jgi:hypothetical protein
VLKGKVVSEELEALLEVSRIKKWEGREGSMISLV